MSLLRRLDTRYAQNATPLRRVTFGDLVHTIAPLVPDTNDDEFSVTGLVVNDLLPKREATAAEEPLVSRPADVWGLG